MTFSKIFLIIFTSCELVILEIFTVLDLELLQVALVIKNLPANAEGMGDTGLVPGSGRSLGAANGNPVQYSSLGNPMDRGPGGLLSTAPQRVGHD